MEPALLAEIKCLVNELNNLRVNLVPQSLTSWLHQQPDTIRHAPNSQRSRSYIISVLLPRATGFPFVESAAEALLGTLRDNPIGGREADVAELGEQIAARERLHIALTNLGPQVARAAASAPYLSGIYQDYLDRLNGEDARYLEEEVTTFYAQVNDALPAPAAPPAGYTLVTSGPQAVWLNDGGYALDQVAQTHLVQGAHGGTGWHQSHKISGASSTDYYLHPSKKDPTLYLMRMDGAHADGNLKITITKTGTVSDGEHRF